jgi:class 3 adenylate cyclase
VLNIDVGDRRVRYARNGEGGAARGIPIRAGIHTGECERRGDEWSGTAVQIGARIGGLAGTGEVLGSRTVRDLSAGSSLVFDSLGPQRFKGLPEDIDVFRVTKHPRRADAQS